LKAKILKILTNSDHASISHYNLTSWFDFAASFWRFSETFQGITEYSNLEERQQGILLYEEIDKLISQNFEDINKK
jgi:hypothetical protein